MRIKTIIAAFAFFAMAASGYAQSTMDNETHSKNLAHQIKILDADIKALKARLKAEPGNADYTAELGKKQAELKKAKSEKKIIDNAIKAEKTNEKEAKDAKKAQQKHESTSKAADALKSSNLSMAGKSNERISDELGHKIDALKTEIKALKLRQKSDKDNASITSELNAKDVELKEAKRHKKVIDEAIKAEKTKNKETKQAQKAQEKHEEAAKKAEAVKAGASE